MRTNKVLIVTIFTVQKVLLMSYVHLSYCYLRVLICNKKQNDGKIRKVFMDCTFGKKTKYSSSSEITKDKSVILDLSQKNLKTSFLKIFFFETVLCIKGNQGIALFP